VSIHKSLRTGDATSRGRNVLTRWERVQKLKEKGRWSEGDPVFGLPKVGNPKVKVGGKKKKKKAEEEEGAAT